MPHLSLRAEGSEVCVVSAPHEAPAGPRAAQSARSIEMVLLGLGQCTFATLRPFFERKGLTLDGVILDLSAQLNEPQNLYEGFRVNVRLTDAVPEPLFAAIAAVARTCRIHRTLSGATAISVEASRSSSRAAVP